MKNSRNKFIKLLACVAVFSFLVVSSGSAAAATIPTSGVMKGVKCAATGVDTSSVSGQAASVSSAGVCGLCDFIQIFTNIADMIVGFSGALAVLIFIYAGIMYLTVSFKPDNVTKAKTAISAALIGLAFIFGGYTIINFVIMTFIGGTDKMGVYSSIISNSTGGQSWGVCEGYETSAPTK